jgi:hypothetical protein
LTQLWHLVRDGRITPGTPQELESILELHVGIFNLSLVPLWAVQCEQTTVWAIPRIICREEVGQSLQGRVRFTLSFSWERFVTDSEANRQRVLSHLNTEREQTLEQYRYVDMKIAIVRRGKPPMSQSRYLSFYDRRDRIQLNDL